MVGLTAKLSLRISLVSKKRCEANARLMILDPVQGYLDSEVDMNRANEVRDVLRQIGAVAERTGCAIVRYIGYIPTQPQ